MRILYAAFRYDIGGAAGGSSYEHHNFHAALVGLGHDVRYVPTDVLSARHGRKGLADRLWSAVREHSPDLLFCCAIGDELVPEVLASITAETRTTTFNWFTDDHWRFDDFSRHLAPCFDYVSTTDPDALGRYAENGCDHVLLTQWGVEPSSYETSRPVPTYDATFVGQVYGDRAAVVRRLRRQGIPVEAWGTGWGSGPAAQVVMRMPLVRKWARGWLERQARSRRLSFEEMLDVFAGSRVNLNFTHASQGDRAQIKGRIFEVPMCGGCLLTEEASGLEHCFEPDVEIATFASPDELLERARYLLAHEPERRRIAAAGHERVLRDHTYAQRFGSLFERMGLPAQP